MNAKLIIDLNVKLKKKTGKNLCHLGFGYEFLNTHYQSMIHGRGGGVLENGLYFFKTVTKRM